jgi:hypothetical protein
VHGKVVERQRQFRARGRRGGGGGGGHRGEEDQGESTTSRGHGSESNARRARLTAPAASKAETRADFQAAPWDRFHGLPEQLITTVHGMGYRLEG